MEYGEICIRLTKQVQREEIEKVIRKQKRNKAVGPDNIPVDA